MSFYDSDLGDFVEIEALVGTAVMVDAQPIDRWIGIDRMSSADTSASYRDGVRPIARRETKGWAEVPLTMDVCRRVALRLELDVDE
jgi:hypothetical protein